MRYLAYALGCVCLSMLLLLSLPQNLATRRRIELLCPARQAGIMTIILTSLKLGGHWWNRTNSSRGNGFTVRCDSPTSPNAQITTFNYTGMFDNNYHSVTNHDIVCRMVVIHITSQLTPAWLPYPLTDFSFVSIFPDTWRTHIRQCSQCSCVLLVLVTQCN